MGQMKICRFEHPKVQKSLRTKLRNQWSVYFSLVDSKTRTISFLKGQTICFRYFRLPSSLFYHGRRIHFQGPYTLHKLRKQVYYISLCSSISIYLAPPLPLACLRRLCLTPYINYVNTIHRTRKTLIYSLWPP